MSQMCVSLLAVCSRFTAPTLIHIMPTLLHFTIPTTFFFFYIFLSNTLLFAQVQLHLEVFFFRNTKLIVSCVNHHSCKVRTQSNVILGLTLYVHLQKGTSGVWDARLTGCQACCRLHQWKFSEELPPPYIHIMLYQNIDSFPELGTIFPLLSCLHLTSYTAMLRS